MKYFSNMPDKEKGCLIIAEIGVNHNGDMELAKKLITKAKQSGADAVKFQTWITEENTGRYAPKAKHQKSSIDDSESQFHLLKRWELNLEQHLEIKAWAEREEIMFFSKPGSPGGLDILRKLNMPMIKIGSPDLTNLPLIKITAEIGLPIIISTGMGTLGEIEEALETIIRTGNDKIMLMHCTSGYPTPPNEVNLRAIDTLRHSFGLPVGFSDHSEGMEMSLAAVAMGAVSIEKHFTVDRTMIGADHNSSMESASFAAMVTCIRNIEKGMGDGIKKPLPSEKDNMDSLRRSLVVLRDLKKGTVLTSELIGIKRPGTGLSPKYFNWVIGKSINRDMKMDEVLSYQIIL